MHEAFVFGFLLSFGAAAAATQKWIQMGKNDIEMFVSVCVWNGIHKNASQDIRTALALSYLDRSVAVVVVGNDDDDGTTAVADVDVVVVAVVLTTVAIVV